MSNTEQPKLTKASLILDDHLLDSKDVMSDGTYLLCKYAIQWAQEEAVKILSSPVQGVEEAAVKSEVEVLKSHFMKSVKSRWPQVEWEAANSKGGCGYQWVYDAMKEYASQFQASRSKGVGMKWVKAKDMMPPLEGKFICRWNMNSNPTVSFQSGIYISNLYVNFDNEVEWLDESAPLSDNSPAAGDKLPQMLASFAEWFSAVINSRSRLHKTSLEIAKEWLQISSASPGSEGKEESRIEEQTARNMDMVGLFVNHVFRTDGIVIPEESILSFFNA